MPRRMNALFFLLVMICCFSFLNIKANTLPLHNRIIYIDSGHGGVDPGAVYQNTYEESINLEIAKKLKNKLIEEGATVYMTREDDYDLSNPSTTRRKRSDLTNRYKIINDTNPDIYVSIHLNSTSSSSWYGAQVFYTNKNQQNKLLAKTIQQQLKKDLGAKREAQLFSGAYMNDHITVPGILIEAGFLSNSNDRYNLKQSDYQEKLVESIYYGIVNYFNEK